MDAERSIPLDEAIDILKSQVPPGAEPQATVRPLSFVESENIRLKEAIRKHRDQKGDDRCWMDDQELYAELRDGNLGDNTVGDQSAMLRNCQRFVELRCKGGGNWKTYAELEAMVASQKEEIITLRAELAARIAGGGR